MILKIQLLYGENWLINLKIKTWATKLDLHHKLHSLPVKYGQLAQAHIKVMTELFYLLAVEGDVSEEGCVVYLLASLSKF